MLKKGIYACLADIADSRDQRSGAVKPRLQTLPIHKQINKAQINNQTMWNAQTEMTCLTICIYKDHKLILNLNEAFPKHIGTFGMLSYIT